VVNKDYHQKFLAAPLMAEPARQRPQPSIRRSAQYSGRRSLAAEHNRTGTVAGTDRPAAAAA